MDTEDKDILLLFQQTERDFRMDDLPMKGIRTRQFYVEMSARIIGIAAMLLLVMMLWSSVPFAESMYDCTAIIIDVCGKGTINWYTQLTKI